MKRSYPPEYVAKLFGVTKGTVIGWCEDGTMPAVNVARAAATRKRWRMSEEDIEEFQRRRQNKTPAQQALESKSAGRKIARPKKDFFATAGGAR